MERNLPVQAHCELRPRLRFEKLAPQRLGRLGWNWLAEKGVATGCRRRDAALSLVIFWLDNCRFILGKHRAASGDSRVQAKQRIVIKIGPRKPITEEALGEYGGVVFAIASQSLPIQDRLAKPPLVIFIEFS